MAGAGLSRVRWRNRWGKTMKSSAKRILRHTFASIGHDTGGSSDNSSRHGTAKAQRREDALEHHLLSLAKENPMRLFCVGDIRTIFHMGKKTMTRLRKLAEKDPISDPWEGDLTNPEQFAKWYWGKRRELQRQFPNN
jgi:hypothetical protein